MSDFPPVEPPPEPTPPPSSDAWATPETDSTGPAPAASRSDAPKQSWKTWAAAGAVALLVAGGGGYAISRNANSGTAATTVAAGGTAANGQAQNGQGFPGGGGTFGTIKSVDGTTFTVETTANGTTAASTVKVTTTDATTVSESVAGNASDLAVGDNIRAMGTTTDAGVTATNIVDNGDKALTGPGGSGGTPPAGAPSGAPTGTPPAGAPTGTPPSGGQGMPGGMGTSGAITAINGSTITVKTSDGTSVKVIMSSTTTVSVTKTRTVADLASGDSVMVMGTTSGSTVAATSIRLGDLASGFGGGFGGGMPPGAADSVTTTTAA